MTIILRCKEGLVAHFGLTCGSWVVASRGSTLRTYLAPMGSSTSASASLGNMMVSRPGSYLYIYIYIVATLKAASKCFYMIYFYCSNVSCRFVLLALLIYAKGGTWTLEQPISSLMFRHRRFQWLLKRLVVAYF